MATLAFTALAGAAGLTGTTAFLANAAALVAGSFIDSRLFGDNQGQESGRLTDLDLGTSSEGVVIKRTFGRNRLSSNLIWATNFKERRSVEREGGSFFGFFGGGTVVTTYTYSISCAFAFCEGARGAQLGRVWADQKLLNLSNLNYRFYNGDGGVDPKIAAVEGSSPAFKGIVYLVFEDLELIDFGNRVPQITAEIILPNRTTSTVEIDAVGIGFGAGEVAYDTQSKVSDVNGNTRALNNSANTAFTDFQVSVTDLRNSFPAVDTVNMAAAWFANGVDARNVTIRPKRVSSWGSIPDYSISNFIYVPAEEPDNGDDGGAGDPDGNSGPSGQTSHDFVPRPVPSRVTLRNGSPVYDGTPGDASLRRGITHLIEQGYDVHFTPTLLIDTDTYPPLSDLTGTPNQTASFFGTAQVSEINVSTSDYTGTTGGWRHCVLHYAGLCIRTMNDLSAAQRAKFTAFYIGSGFSGLTKLHNGNGSFLFVNGLNQLITDVRSMFVAAGYAHVVISYAADWDEYHSQKIGNDIYFNMDPLWNNADFIAINHMAPISDWRDGADHLDYGEGLDAYGNVKTTSIYDIEYLKGQIEGGEYYDYTYATEIDRLNQTRTPIVDAGYGAVWAYRQKDITNWKKTTHSNYVNGVHTPGFNFNSKPLTFPRFGCHSVNKGTNEPTSNAPPYTSGSIDNAIVNSYLRAMLAYWGGGSVASDMLAYSWDARPYPAFPNAERWGDSEDWSRGLQLAGKINTADLQNTVATICEWAGVQADVTGIADIQIDGYTIDNISSPRDMLTPLFSTYFFDGFESGGVIKFVQRKDTNHLKIDDIVIENNNPSGFVLTRGQEVDLPQAVRISYIDGNNDYQIASTGAQKQNTSSNRIIELRQPLVMQEGVARAAAELAIQDIWAGRENISLGLPNNLIALEPGDGIIFNDKRFRIEEINNGQYLELTARSFDISIYDYSININERRHIPLTTTFGSTILQFIDLPVIDPASPRLWATRLAAYQSPFPPSVDVYFARADGQHFLNTQIPRPSQMGRLVRPLPYIGHHVIDEGSVLEVSLFDTNYQILARSEDEVRSGANLVAISVGSGLWEILKFVNVELVSAGVYRLTRLFRGQYGTYSIARDVPAQTRVVFLDQDALGVLTVPVENRNDETMWRFGPSTAQLTSDFYQTTTEIPVVVALKPYAPADLQLHEMHNSSNILATWKRQTRFGGEGFEDAMVPLREDDELYRVYLLDGNGVVLHTEDVTEPEYEITAAFSSFQVGQVNGYNEVGYLATREW